MLAFGSMTAWFKEVGSGKRKELRTMIRKLFLFIFMIIPLLGAIIAGVPFPVLLAMGGLVLFGITVAPERDQ
jgi:hypothetical protein